MSESPTDIVVKLGLALEFIRIFIVFILAIPDKFQGVLDVPGSLSLSLFIQMESAGPSIALVLTPSPSF